jgi:hypothetical protein
MIAVRASFLLSSLKASLLFGVLTSIFVMGLGGWQLPRGQTRSETSLRSRAQLLGSETAISFPEQLVLTPSGKAYLLDTDLSTLFTVDHKDGRINRMCGSETLSGPSDITVDRNGNVWVLSALHSKIIKLTPKCQAQAQVVSRNMPLRIATNTLGELIVLNGTGDLFELYGSDGKLLRGFGKRIDYKDETTNSELSDGRIAADTSGGFFFSFNYPPLIRHYARNGTLISEFKPESDVPIDPPNVSVRKQGNSTVVRARYQVLVLDMAADARGRLFLLLSGKNKVPALTEGTPKLVVVGEDGRVLKRAVLENNFHRLAISNGRLFLLRNRVPFRLDEYPLL